MNRGTLKGFADKVEKVLPLRTTWYWSGSGKHRLLPQTKRYTVELQAPGAGGAGTYFSGSAYPGQGGGAGGRTFAQMTPVSPGQEFDWQIGVPGTGGAAATLSGGTNGGDVVFGVLSAEGGKAGGNGQIGAGGIGVGQGINGGAGGAVSADTSALSGAGGKRPGGAGTEANGGAATAGKSGGGGGGSSPYGRGGTGANAGAANQRGGTGSGFGGGGGGGANNGDGRGGDGAPGFICIKEYAG